MLSQSEKLIEKKRLLSLPPLERPITVRLKFRKVGTLQYISHLDLQRTFNRVLVRACLPVWYTKGFNPHAKLVFSTPLSVGAQSVCEFLDIRMDREMDCAEIMERLNRELTDELYITDAYLPNSDFSEIAWASYDLRIHTEGVTGADASVWKKTLTEAPLPLIKKTKAGEKEIDIIPLIHSCDIVWNEETQTMDLATVLRAASGEYLNPEMLITALKLKNGILRGNPLEEWYSIMRTSVLKADFSLFA